MSNHNFKEYPLNKAFQLIEPGPVILLVTSKEGRANIMTLSWSTLLDFTPQIACCLSPGDFSYETLKSTKQCVIAIPTIDMMEKVVRIGNCSGKETDKFKKFKLTPLASKSVGVPLISECLANIECEVTDISLAEKYGLFVLEGLRAWFDDGRDEKRTFHANGDGTFVKDGESVNLKHLMTKWSEFI